MKILRSFIAFVGVIGMLTTMSSCTDWGKADDPAGSNVYPAREQIAKISFDYADDEEALSEYYHSDKAEVVTDDVLGSKVLHLDKEQFIRIPNPILESSGLQNGVGITMYVRTDSVTLHPALFSFGGETLAEETTSERFYLTENSWLSYNKPGQLQSLDLDENNPDKVKTGAMANDKNWHFIALQLKSDGYVFYVDGKKKTSQDFTAERPTQFSYKNLLSFLETAPYLYIGVGNDSTLAETWVDDITIIRNQMTAKDWDKQAPTGGGTGPVSDLPIPVYFNDFSSADGLTIVGAGQFRSDATKGFGQVFQNAASTAPRSNYLLLPEDVLSHSAESQQMTIGFWVNAANAGASVDYMWAPLFMAYGAAPVNGENTFPMFACQYRGVLQVNNAGWTDYTDAQNVKGVNSLYHAETDWLADKQWHYYTVVFDGENAKVYFDGEVVNEWNADGVNNTQRGLFNAGNALKYICLGGNQAWNWGDNDPGFEFDDIMFFDFALTPADIQTLMSVYK
jgi:hypothetical protein